MKIEVRHFSLLLFISIALSTAQPALAQDEVAGGESYTVRKGDTLWDISATKLENPFSWSLIWKQNPSIKDPDLIYPGEKIALPPGAVLKKTEGAPGAAAAGGDSASRHGSDSEPFVESGKTILKGHADGGKVITIDTTRPKMPIATLTEIMSAGFISPELKGARKISDGLLGGREIYSFGDKLYTDVDGVSIGDVFLIARETDKVCDPASGDKLGKIVFPTGSFKITEKVDGKMAGVVEKSFTEIKPDDLLIPYTQPQLVYEPVPPNDKLNGKFGYVAAVKEEKATSTQIDTVYLDMGSDMGVKPGDRFVIRRSGGKGRLMEGIDQNGYASPSDYVVPDKAIGEVVVISVQPKNSTAKVASFNEVIRPGYRAVYKD